MYKDLKLKLAEKIKNNNIKIGSDLREFRGVSDGDYFKNPYTDFIEISHIFNWTTGFFNGMSSLAYEFSGDNDFLKWNEQFYDEYLSKVNTMETMHDLGFLYSPYAVFMYNQTNDEKYKLMAIKAADELAKRYNPFGEYIRAWGRADNNTPKYVDAELAKDHFFTKGDGLAIIDCMMNLPLLFWASEASGNPFYRRIAIKHANTTVKHFIREDYSVKHAFRFNPEDGEPIGEENYCGFGIGSHWARGTAWAIYGFIIAYRYTKKQEYLDLSVKLCEKFIDLCESDFVPVWDFRLPKDAPAMPCNYKTSPWDVKNKENIKFNRDTSACAIVICAIKEILKHKSIATFADYKNNALKSLIDNYINTDLNTAGILKCQNGMNIYTSFGDYYFVEALCELKKEIW